jgi:hypothetical protein
MPTQYIVCPKCHTKIKMTEAFTQEIEEKLRGEYEEKLEDERSKAEKQAKKKAEEALSIEMKDLKEQIEEKTKALEKSRKEELELRKRQRELEEREENLKLDTQKLLDKERKKIREEAEAKIADEHHQRDLEKEKQLSDMRKQIEDLKRKAEQTSQQTQGEVQELELENILNQQFRLDKIEPVAKGVRGADVVHEIHDEKGLNCGKIIWESKRTKAWSDSWVQKLKDDKRTEKADLAVLVTTSLPKEINRFGYYDGIWVTDFGSVIGLAMALRENLIQLAYVRSSLTGQSEKKDLMYNYLSGPQFRQRVEAIVEAFVNMKTDLDSEKRAMEKTWAKREAQINRVIHSTAGMYGELQDIIGAALPEVKILELPQ